jgi:hypothetical protein
MSFLTKKFFVRPKFHKSFVVLQLESLIPIYSKVTPSNVSESRKKVWDLGYEKKWLLNKKRHPNSVWALVSHCNIEILDMRKKCWNWMDSSLG